MSAGLLKATVAGEAMEFDGETWTGEEQTAELLNLAFVPLHHYDLRAAAERCLERIGFDYTIDQVEEEELEELPAGAIS